jgi:hypothetical protein
MKHIWTCIAFWNMNNMKWRKWCKFDIHLLFNNTYGFPVLTKDTKYPNQVFIFDRWIYRSFVPNTGWKRDSLQMMIFVNVFSTWSIVELKTRFETWITRNDVNGVGLFHLSYLLTLMAYLCSEWAPNVQVKYFMFDWLIYRLFVLNGTWKRDSLQIMIFVYVSSTWSIGEIKTRFETWITRNDVNGVRLFHFSYLITLIVYLFSQ